MFSAKAKFPTNKLIVKPIPVKTDTPYKLSQLELSGICAMPVLTATKEKIIQITEKYPYMLGPSWKQLPMTVQDVKGKGKGMQKGMSIDEIADEFESCGGYNCKGAVQRVYGMTEFPHIVTVKTQQQQTCHEEMIWPIGYQTKNGILQR